MNKIVSLVQKARVDFIYMPLVAAPIVPNLFVLPGHHDLLPLLPHEIHHIFTENQVQLETYAQFIFYQLIM